MNTFNSDLMIHVGVYDKGLFVPDSIRMLCEKSSTELSFSFATQDENLLVEKLNTIYTDILIFEIDFPLDRCKKFISELKNYFPLLKILAFSNYADNCIVREILPYSINGYLYKTSGMETIKNVLQNIHLSGNHFTIDSNEMLNRRRDLAFIQLSEKQKEIIYLTRLQLSNNEIARKLSISIKSVEKHKTNLISLTDSKKMTGVIEYLIKHQLIPREI